MPSSSIGPRGAGHSLKSRLYAIIGFLGLLPVLGLTFALLAVQSSSHDTAALDRAARGTIDLERINGLVYAVVMESRGIYMSADWQAAEPFATRLVRQLKDLQDVAKNWREEASASRRASVEELSRRIDQFVQFRTELVRLAKEDSTAAARVFGDNDANRSVRTALNESLSVVARANEDEIGRARTNVEDDGRAFMIVLAVLAALAFLALCAGLMLIKKELLRPLLGVKHTMLRLAGGNLDLDASHAPRTAEIGEMMQAVGVFHANLVERRKLNRETRLLSALNEWLQSCNSLGELYEMVAEFLARLLPGCAGSLYIYANSRDVLESAKSWNNGKVKPTMHPEDCWGLRRGLTYSFGENEIDFPCAHLDDAHPESYCCIPILAHGETIGLLHLEFSGSHAGHAAATPEEVAEQRRLGLICAEQISLAIANVRLRDQLRDQSIRDVLTGLFNRRYMLETCRREFSRATRAGQGVSVLSIDVDHFKKYNDNHGHDAGDTVLRAVGGCLSTMFRNEDVACRFGGEEFVVILPGASADIGLRRAEQLRLQIEALIVRYLEENLPRITISIGVASFPNDGNTPEAVLKVADEALYRAKEGGRNRVETSWQVVDGEPATPTKPGKQPSAPRVVDGLSTPEDDRRGRMPVLVDAADG
jgi:diguanylate cyclase (GGDEF)-like protein